MISTGTVGGMLPQTITSLGKIVTVERQVANYLGFRDFCIPREGSRPVHCAGNTCSLHFGDADTQTAYILRASLSLQSPQIIQIERAASMSAGYGVGCLSRPWVANSVTIDFVEGKVSGDLDVAKSTLDFVLEGSSKGFVSGARQIPATNSLDTRVVLPKGNEDEIYQALRSFQQYLIGLGQG